MKYNAADEAMQRPCIRLEVVHELQFLFDKQLGPSGAEYFTGRQPPRAGASRVSDTDASGV